MRARAGIGLIMVLAVAGCGAAEGEGSSGKSVVPVAESSVDETPPAFHFQSGDLVLGEFDPYAVVDDLFDPCSEISEEEFAVMGLEKRGDQGGSDRYGVNSCLIEEDDHYVTSGIFANAVNKELILQRKEVEELADPNLPPGTYAFEDGPSGMDMCTVTVDTARGTLGVSVMNIHPSSTHQERCEHATGLLKAIYTAVN